MTTKPLTSLLCVALAAGSLVTTSAHAALILDSGTPDNSKSPLSLDGSDFVAAEFRLGDGATLTTVQAYLNGGSGSTAGSDSFSIVLYAADAAGGLPGTQIASVQAIWNADGWNGASGLNWSGLAAGDYWVAFEVGGNDSTTGLEIPVIASLGTVPAHAYAFSAGAGYQYLSGNDIGVQVSAVPLPPAWWLLSGALAGIAAMRRRRA